MAKKPETAISNFAIGVRGFSAMGCGLPGAFSPVIPQWITLRQGLSSTQCLHIFRICGEIGGEIFDAVEKMAAKLVDGRLC
jgi:hypothetical protein